MPPLAKPGMLSMCPLSLAITSGEQYAYSDHGHRFDFLLKPLPPTEDEEVPAPKR